MAGTARRVGVVLVALLALAFPWIVSTPALRYLGAFTLMYVGLAVSWNLLGGYTGYISLGHVAFFGLGAYFAALTSTRLELPVIPMILLAGVFSAVLGVAIGYLALRSRGASFVIVTLALVYIVRYTVQAWRGLTLGSRGVNLEGLSGMPRELYHVPFFYGFLLLAAAAIAMAWFIRRSKFGMALEAIREDEDKAQAVGINTSLYTLIAFTISVGLTGMIGGLYAWWTAFIEPVFVFDIVIGVNIILMCLLGGMRTLWGPVLGAVLLVPASDYIVANLGAAQLYLFGVGTLLAVLVLALPEGIIPTVGRLLERRGPQASSISEQTREELIGSGSEPS